MKQAKKIRVMLNLFQHLPRITVLQQQQQALKTLKQVQGDFIRAFTLIELLVVVLIIGILAAIALPGYERAVERSRVAEARIVLNSVYKAYQLCTTEFGPNAEECYAVNNDDPEELPPLFTHTPVELPGEWHTALECPIGLGLCARNKNWSYESDELESFSARRTIGDDFTNGVYWIYMDFHQNGSMKCYNNGAKDYCKMICGGQECFL